MKLLINMRGVPEDEAEELRELLAGHDIDFYETQAGTFGISQAGLWLRDEGQWKQASALLADYHQQRQQQAREQQEQLRREGRQLTTLDLVRQSPLRYLAYIAVIVGVLVLSTKPFFDFWR